MPSREERIQNLKKANEQSHRVIVDSLREAMYELIETEDVSDIKVVDLIRKAGVSRGGFYKNFYLVTDVLKDDIKEVSDDVKKAIGRDIGSNIGANWEMILQAVYSYRKKIPLLIKVGMGMQILDQMNAGIESKEEAARMRIVVWNGIIFNCILYWNSEGYRTPISELAMKMTEITQALQKEARSAP